MRILTNKRLCLVDIAKSQLLLKYLLLVLVQFLLKLVKKLIQKLRRILLLVQLRG